MALQVQGNRGPNSVSSTNTLTRFGNLVARYVFDVNMFPSEAVAKAREQMRRVPLPTYPIDIFRKPMLIEAKLLMSSELNFDPTPGFDVGSVLRKCSCTLESYFADKHLSSRVGTEFMIEVLKRVEEAVKKQLATPYQKPSDRYYFYEYTITGFGCPGDQFAASWREVNFERLFVDRVAERHKVEVERKLLKELSLPNFIHPKSTAALKRGIKQVLSGEEQWLARACFESNMEGADRDQYTAFLETFYDERDRRVLEILTKAWAKDLAVRAIKPDAPLIHFTTVQSYEIAIYQKRKQLVLKIVAAVAIILLLQRHPSFNIVRRARQLLPSKWF